MQCAKHVALDGHMLCFGLLREKKIRLCVSTATEHVMQFSVNRRKATEYIHHFLFNLKSINNLYVGFCLFYFGMIFPLLIFIKIKTMKRILFSAIVCLLMSTGTGFAQGFSLGVKAGADINKLDATEFKDGFSFGYQLGAYAEIRLSKKFAIQPEVLFSQVNIDTSDRFSDVYQFNDLSEVQLKYLKIPLLLNYKASKVLTLQAGPQFGILIDQNINLVNNGENAFRSGDFSMLAGAQVHIGTFHIFGRYGIGLTNLNDIDNRDKWKNQNIQLGVGVKIL